jgi:hypothetical protein
MTVLMTWPLARGFGSLTLGPPGDNLEYIWKAWWFKHSIIDLQASPSFSPDVYYPIGYNLALSEMTPANNLLALPITAALGPVVAYNVLIFGSFVLSAFTMYLLVVCLTGSPAAAVVSGAIFAFSPYRMIHSAGHLPLMGTYWLPLLFLAIEGSINQRKLRYSALAGLAYSGAALSSWYYAVYAAALLPIYLIVRLRAWRRYPWDPWMAKAVGVFLAVVLAMVLPYALPYLQLNSDQRLSQPFQEHLDLSATPSDLLRPSLLHPLWGGWLLRRLAPSVAMVVERSISLGAVPLALAILGFWGRRRHQSMQALAAMGLASFAFACGPILQVGGSVAKVGIPPLGLDVLDRLGILPFLAERLGPDILAQTTNQGQVFLPLPGMVLYLFVPGFTATRVWARFGVFTMLVVAAAAGCGVAALLHGVARVRLPGRPCALPALTKAAVAGLLVVEVLFEFVSIVPSMSSAVRPREVDLWLREQPGDFAIMEYPIVPLRAPDLYYSITHQKKLILGYGSYVPEEFEQWIPILASFPSPESLRLLYGWNVRYILLDVKAYGDALGEVLRACAGLDNVQLVEEMDGIYVYQLRALAPPHAVQARLGEVGELLGFGLDPAEVAPGSKLRITLFWRSLGSTPVPYKVFAHLVTESGEIVAQHDAEPCRWKCPTIGWVPNGLLFDVHSIAIGPEVQRGEYTLLIGMYDEASGERVPAYNDRGDLLPEGTIVLGSVRVEG